MLLAIAVLIAFAECAQQPEDCSRFDRQKDFAVLAKQIGGLTLKCSLVLKSAEKLQRGNGDYLYSRRSIVPGTISDNGHFKDLIGQMPKSEIKNGNYSYYGCSWRRHVHAIDISYKVYFEGIAACIFRRNYTIVVCGVPTQ